MDCLVATLSVDPVKSHQEWLRDVVAHCENEIEVKFPIIGTHPYLSRQSLCTRFLVSVVSFSVQVTATAAFRLLMV
jgi:hypothetical protein